MSAHQTGEAADAGVGEPYDREGLAELEDLFGRPRLMELLGALDTEIGQRLSPPDADPSRLARDAHVLVSSSGALAFTALSRACAALEQACLKGEPHGGALDAALEAAGAARRAIATLRSTPA